MYYTNAWLELCNFLARVGYGNDPNNSENWPAIEAVKISWSVFREPLESKFKDQSRSVFRDLNVTFPEKSMDFTGQELTISSQDDMENKLFELKEFLDRIYDSGVGTQYLFGTIWFTDGTWATREGRDCGSEYWRHQERPKPPC